MLTSFELVGVLERLFNLVHKMENVHETAIVEFGRGAGGVVLGLALNEEEMSLEDDLNFVLSLRWYRHSHNSQQKLIVRPHHLSFHRQCIHHLHHLRLRKRLQTFRFQN
jgi:hypothetical protein